MKQIHVSTFSFLFVVLFDIRASKLSEKISLKIYIMDPSVISRSIFLLAISLPSECFSSQ